MLYRFFQGNNFVSKIQFIAFATATLSILSITTGCKLPEKDDLALQYIGTGENGLSLLDNSNAAGCNELLPNNAVIPLAYNHEPNSQGFVPLLLCPADVQISFSNSQLSSYFIIDQQQSGEKIVKLTGKPDLSLPQDVSNTIQMSRVVNGQTKIASATYQIEITYSVHNDQVQYNNLVSIQYHFPNNLLCSRKIESSGVCPAGSIPVTHSINGSMCKIARAPANFNWVYITNSIASCSNYNHINGDFYMDNPYNAACPRGTGAVSLPCNSQTRQYCKINANSLSFLQTNWDQQQNPTLTNSQKTIVVDNSLLVRPKNYNQTTITNNPNGTDQCNCPGAAACWQPPSS